MNKVEDIKQEFKVLSKLISITLKKNYTSQNKIGPSPESSLKILKLVGKYKANIKISTKSLLTRPIKSKIFKFLKRDTITKNDVFLNRRIYAKT